MLDKQDSIIILLGAGASVDAGVPHSSEMIQKIERRLQEHNDWIKHKDLYNYIKSSIFYGEGIKGNFSNDKVQFNIERLVNTLDELAKKEDHPLYPFVGSWNPKLTEVVHTNFKNIEEFKKLIVNELIDEWIQLEDYSRASYFEKLVEFQKAYEYPLRIFTLNYDLCLEKNSNNSQIQTGFDTNRTWNWRLFDEGSDNIDIFLYKLHGSINWKRDQETGSLKIVERHTNEAEIIFGTSYKLQYVDPFLFLAYEFRRWTLETDLKLIVAIGYAFGDEHINSIISQSLSNDPNRKLLVVSPSCHEESNRQKVSNLIKTRHGDDQIHFEGQGAKEFLESTLTMEKVKALFPNEEPTPF